MPDVGHGWLRREDRGKDGQIQSERGVNTARDGEIEKREKETCNP